MHSFYDTSEFGLNAQANETLKILVCLQITIQNILREKTFYGPRALRIPVSHVPRVIRALELDVPSALHTLVPHVRYMLIYFTFVEPGMFSCLSCLVPYVLLYSSSSTCFKSNMLIRISCLITFMSWASFAFDAWAIWVYYSLVKINYCDMPFLKKERRSNGFSSEW